MFGHTTTHEWDRRPHCDECVVALPTSVLGAKLWLISILSRSVPTLLVIHTLYTVFEVELFRDHLRLVHSRACVMTSQWQMNLNKSRPRQTRTWRGTFKWMYFANLKARMISHRHCICPENFLEYIFSIYKVKTDNQVRVIPTSIMTLCLVHLPVGCAPAMHGFSIMTSRQSSSSIGEDRTPQATHGWAVVECTLHAHNIQILTQAKGNILPT